MKLPANSPALLAAGLAVTLACVAWITYGRVQSVHVPREATPEHVPLTVCAGDDGVDVAAMTEAVSVAADLGHPVALTEPSRSCDIVIESDDSLEGHGVTHALIDERGIHSAHIAVRGTAGPLVYTHELMHALGYALRHDGLAPPTGHLMHPTSPGWDTRGLEL